MNPLEICFDHWYTEPAIGYWPAISMKQSATRIWPPTTTGHVHHTPGPAFRYPNPYSAVTPVRIEM